MTRHKEKQRLRWLAWAAGLSSEHDLVPKGWEVKLLQLLRQGWCRDWGWVGPSVRGQCLESEKQDVGSSEPRVTQTRSGFPEMPTPS